MNELLELMMKLSKTSGEGTDEALREFSRLTGIDVKNHNAGFQIARFLLPLLYKNLAEQQIFSNEIAPVGRRSASDALGMLTNPDAMNTQYRDKASAAAGSTLQSVLQRLRSGGAGAGATAGAALNASNQANTAGNQFQAQMDSPDGRMERLNAILGLIGSQKPDFGNLMNLNSITQGTPRGQSGLQSVAGMLSGLGQIGAGLNAAGLRRLLGGGPRSVRSTVRKGISTPASLW